MAEGLIKLISAAGTLSDVELAVALQGILTRRPAVRNAVYGVLQAEDFLYSGAAVSDSTAQQQDRVERPAASSGPSDPVTRLRIGSRRLAGFHGAKTVCSEHVLAAAVFMLPNDFKPFLGAQWYACLLDVLKQKDLKPPGPSDGQRLAVQWDDLPLSPEAEQIFADWTGTLTVTSVSLFHILVKLPNSSSASQLLETAQLLSQQVLSQQAEELQSDLGSQRNAQLLGLLEVAPRGVQQAEADTKCQGDSAKSGAEVQGEEVASLTNLAKRFAAHNHAKVAGTEHILAAAMEAFPEEASSSLGKPLYDQLLELLAKSSLEPPGGQVTADGIGLEREAVDLFAAWAQRGASPANMVQLLQSMPDADSATQLLEMAKIFAERSSLA